MFQLPLLEVINLSHCSLRGSCLPALVEALGSSDSLKQLHLAGNLITKDDISPLCG